MLTWKANKPTSLCIKSRRQKLLFFSYSVILFYIRCSEKTHLVLACLFYWLKEMFRIPVFIFSSLLSQVCSHKVTDTPCSKAEQELILKFVVKYSICAEKCTIVEMYLGDFYQVNIPVTCTEIKKKIIPGTH